MTESNPSPSGGSKSIAPESSSAVRELDCTNVSRLLWLIKVPKYVAAAWEACEEEEVGKCHITTNPTSRTHQIKIKLNESIAKDFSSEFELNPVPIVNMKMAAISRSTDETELAMLGSINRRADLRPSGAGNQAFMEMKKLQIVASSEPSRKTQRTELKVNYKPVSDHGKRLTTEEKEEKKVTKKLRDDKDVVVEKILAAFEKHQYINIKDLVEITNQPVTFVKELLNEYCVYNTKNPHRNMWELKPEFRHY